MVIWVLVGFHGGDRSSLRLGFWGWVTTWLKAVGAGLNRFGVSVVWAGLGLIGFFGFSWCFDGDLLQWVAVAVLGGAGFVIWWCCGGGLLWRRWVGLGLCFGGVVVVGCCGNVG